MYNTHHKASNLKRAKVPNYLKGKLERNILTAKSLQQEHVMDCTKNVWLQVSSYRIPDPNCLFLYPPSSGIAPCVGTAGTVNDEYT